MSHLGNCHAEYENYITNMCKIGLSDIFAPITVFYNIV